MEVPDLISTEVWQEAKTAFANHEHWVAYNNTLLFVHSSDIRFFSNREDAEDFSFGSINESENWKVERIASLAAFKERVESEMPGLVYTPVKEQAAAFAPETLPGFFPKDELLKNKKIIMTTENLEYLKNQLLFLGFGETLYSQLEAKMKEGKPEFTLQATGEFGKDKMEAVIHFRHSTKEGQDAYFCNHYVSTLLREDQNRSQFFYVNNKGQNITFKESCNLLNSRSVYKEITPKTGEPYHAWLKIDHENIDPKTNYPKLRQYTANYGFDLKEAIGRLDFKGMKYDEQFKKVMKSLQKGNATAAILVKGEKKIPVLLEANPRLKTLNMYDKNGASMFYPSQKVEEKYRQVQADAPKKEAAVVNEPKIKYEKKDLLTKNKPGPKLIEKKNTKAKTKSRKLM